MLRPLWLANGVADALHLEEDSFLERTTRFAGKVKRDSITSAGATRYQKSGEIDAKLAIWGTTLYWVSNGWFVRGTDRAGSGKYAILCLDDGYIKAPALGLFRVFDSGLAAKFSFTVDLEPGRTDGKRILLIKGRSVDQRQLWIYLDEGKITAKIFYDNAGTENSVIMQTKRSFIVPNEKFRIDVYIDLVSSAFSYMAIDQEKLETIKTGVWPGGGNTINVVPVAAQSLFGVNLEEPDTNAFEEGLRSFVGYVYQVRASAALESPLHEGMDDGGPLSTSADTDLLLLMEEGDGWTFANTGTAASAVSAINGATGLIPILEDLPFGDESLPYSMDQFRGSLYGTNGQGRQFYARWTGDFVTNPSGWQTGPSGILAPQTLPYVYKKSLGAAVNNTAGEYLVAYSYLDSSTGMRSNPSAIIPITLTAADVIAIGDLQASEDPRVDGIEVWITQANGGYMGRVITVGNGSNSVDLDYPAATVRASDEISFSNAVPPKATLIKFVGGRAYWAGVEGNEGVLSFAEPDYEESWSSLNQKQVDSSRWGPIVGIGGQRGAIHIYTRDSIFRAIDGGGDILTFQFGLVVSGIGAIDQFTLLDVDGLEMFMSRNGLFAFDGSQTHFIGPAVERQTVGVAGVSRGANPRSVPMWAVWDARRQMALWFFRDLDQEGPTGDAICMSRRVNDQPSWSTLDFYDVTSATDYEDINGIPGIMLTDSMGYAWAIEDPAADTDNCLDLDGLGIVLEDGTARALVGDWGVTSMLGHLAGDGARGLPFLTYTLDANGVVSGYGMNRLLRTPAAAVLVAGDAEGPLGAWDKWVLGGFFQGYESAWGPYPSIEMNKMANLFDMGFSPLAGETALLMFEGVQGNHGRAMENEFTSTATRLRVALDTGFLDGIPMNMQSRFRALRYAVQYFGTKNLDVAEIVIRWNPEGGARGPGG